MDWNEVWVLRYRAGNFPTTGKYFVLSGTLKEAAARGIQHCAAMGYRFINVTPLISDLIAEERDHFGTPAIPIAAAVDILKTYK